MGYDLGVDLGGTSAAAAVTTDSRPEMVTLGDRTMTVPAVVFLGDDGTLIAGDAAARRAVGHPARVGRELRRRLGSPTPVRLGGTAYPPAALLGALLQDVVTRVAENVGSKPDSVLLTHPAHWSPVRRAAFTEAIRAAALPDVRTATEPEAVAAHYAAGGRLADGDTVAVYDLGGGTFDATVLRRTGPDIELLGLPEGIERLGGGTFDEAILSHVNRTAGNPLAGLDRRDPQNAAAVARLRQECVLAKETLSAEDSTTIPVLLPNRQAEVSLTRAGFEEMIRTSIETTVGTLLKALQSAQVETNDLAAVLLVGDSTRIPLVRRMLTDALARPTVLDPHPKYPVALGAATLAAAARTAEPASRWDGLQQRDDPVQPGRPVLPGAPQHPLGPPAPADGHDRPEAQVRPDRSDTRPQPATDREPDPHTERVVPAAVDELARPDAPSRPGTPPPAPPDPHTRPVPPVPVDEPDPVATAPVPRRHPVGAPGAAESGGPATDQPVRPAAAGPVTSTASPVSLFEPARPAAPTDAPPAPAPTELGRRPPGAATIGDTAIFPLVQPAERSRPSFLAGNTTVVPTPVDADRPAGIRTDPRPPSLPFTEAGPAGHGRGADSPVPPNAPPPPPAGAGGGRPRRRMLATLLAVALVVVLAGVGFLVWNRQPGAPGAGPGAPAQAAPDGRPAVPAASVPSPRLGSVVPVGETPGFVVVSPDGRQALVANQAAGVVTVVDTATNAVTARIPVPTGPPQYLAFAPDGRHVYVSIWDQARTVAAVGVLDTATDAIVATIPVRTRPYLSAVTPDGQRLYVPNHDSGTVSVIDTGTNTVTTEIKVAANPHWIEMSADGTRAYAANHESNLVSVIDTADNSILAEVPVQLSPHSLAIRPGQPLVANVNYDSASVTMIDTNTDQVVATIPVGKNPQDITWAPDGRHAYVANTTDGTVSVIDGDTATVTTTIRTGGSPTSIAVLPDGSAAYVSNLADGTLAVLDIAG